MNEETRKLIESLAASLGTTAEHLWQVLLRQAYISFWTDLLFYTITAVGVWFTAKCSAKFWQQSHKDEFNELEWQMASTGVCIPAAIFLLICVCSIGDTITKLANPEYWALTEVLKALSK